MMVPYVEILNRALNKYGSNCDLYEILLYVQRFIENEKIPIGRILNNEIWNTLDLGPAGQYMKGSHQQTLTKKLYFFRGKLTYNRPLKFLFLLRSRGTNSAIAAYALCLQKRFRSGRLSRGMLSTEEHKENVDFFFK